MMGKKNNFIFVVLCCCLIVAGTFLCSSTVAAASTLTLSISGRIPLTAYNITVSGIDTSHATVSWKTNGDANSTVEYGTTSGYGSVGFDKTEGAGHAITLNGLSPGTPYHYRVLSADLAGEQYTSADFTFQTLSPPGTVVTSAAPSTTFAGTTIQTVGGAQQVSLNETLTTGTIQISGNTVTVENPGNGWSRLEYVGSNVVIDDGNVSTGPIQSVSMQSEPVTASLGGNIGTVSTQIDIGLKQVISDVSIQQNIIQGASTTVADAFQVAATNNHLDVKAIAYTVEFQNTAPLDANLNSDGVTLNLSIDNAWVAANAPGGSVDNVKILRLGDDGTTEVLSTTYLGSQGTTDYFEAISPHGLSTFGIVAVASSSTSGGSGGSGSSGGSGDGSTGGGESIGGSILVARPPGAPVTHRGQPILVPPHNEPKTVQSLAVAGLSTITGSSGVQTFTLDTALAAQSGVSVTVENNVIIITQPGLTLKIVTSGNPVIVNGIISGIVQSASITTTPSIATLSCGTVSVSVDASLATIPGNAVITTTLSETVSPETKSAFQQAAQSDNRQVDAIAYVMTVETTNFVATGPAVVTMTVPSNWVASHGESESVAITHWGDDRTSVEMLDTSYRGMNAQGDMAFEGKSSHGLSVFGLVQVTTLKPPRQDQPEVSLKELPPQGTFGNASVVIEEIGLLMTNNYIVIILCAGLAALFLVFYLKRETPGRYRNERK